MKHPACKYGKTNWLYHFTNFFYFKDIFRLFRIWVQKRQAKEAECSLVLWKDVRTSYSYNWNVSINIFTAGNEVGARFIFSEACVKNSVHRGGSAPLHAGIPPGPEADLPGSRHPPRANTLGADTPPPPRSRSPQEQTPWHSACWEIWATSGRYTSYWNAYLFECMFRENGTSIRSIPSILRRMFWKAFHIEFN